MSGRLGPIGGFPHGRLAPDDEGGLKIAVSAERNRVIIRFGKEISWLGLDRDTALALAAAVEAHAKQCSVASPEAPA